MSDEIKDKFPKRPASHVIGDRAVNVFKYKAKKEWVTCNEPKTDYGWDILISIEEGGRVKEDFFVQLKGHKSSNYIEGKKYISESLKISTLNYLLGKPVPSMLCVVDEGRSDEPIFYIWIKDAMREIAILNPAWAAQESVSLKIPVTNIFDATSHSVIEKDVKNYYTELRIQKIVAEAILPDQLSSESLNSFRENPEAYIFEDGIAAKLKDAGLVDIIDEEGIKKIEKLSPEDQALNKKITEASTFLNTFNDKEAERVLSSLDSKIEKAAEGVRARFFNNKGVLALHLGHLDKALQFFKAAYELRPLEAKYITNYLLSQLLKYMSSKDSPVLAENFSDLIDDVIKKNPEFWSAIRLKTFWLSEFRSLAEAEDFIKKSQALEKDPAHSYGCLAEIYKDKNRIDDAIKILEELENKQIPLDENFYSLMGLLNFQKGLGITYIADEKILYGAGPAELNINILEKAKTYYAKACQILAGKGFPKSFESCIVNLATIYDLLGEYAESELICKTALQHHPKSQNVNGALSASLVKQGRFIDAKKHARVVFELDNKSALAFKNLILCIYFSEDYEEVLKLASIRDGHYVNKDEEGLVRLFAALSYAELGLEEEANKQLDIMEKNPDLRIKSIIARADLKDKFGEKTKAQKIYRDALKEHPEDLELLYHFVASLSPVSKENAEEVLKILLKLKEKRQLVQEEFYQLGRAYLLIDKPENGEEVFREALNRYPTDHRFLFQHALVQFALGHEDLSFAELQNYLEIGERDYNVLRTIAIIARDADKIDDAIKFFSYALTKASNDKQKGEIHCQLYELKSRRDFPAKERLKHIAEFGKVTNEEPELEARYLMLFTFATVSDLIEDDEVKGWIKAYQARLDKFVLAHPKFPTLRVLPISGQTEEEKAHDFLSSLTAITLPHKLTKDKFEIATRSGEWPFVFRSKFLYRNLSAFEYWAICTKSNEPEHSIHIWRPYNDLRKEVQFIQSTKKICVDITALLTLAQLDLLDLLCSFKQIVISSETRLLLKSEKASFKNPHPLALKIENWRIANRLIVRTRSLKDLSEENDDSYTLVNGIFIKKSESIDKTFGEGVGETLLLAQKLNLPLYSDEAFIRNIANTEFNVRAFSSISLIKFLLSISEETRIFSQMLLNNFKVVPFSAAHLNCRFRELLNKKVKGEIVKSTELISDEILCEYLKQFSEYTYLEDLSKIALEWWLEILADQKISYDQLPECMFYISYSISMKTIGTILHGIPEKEQERRAAGLWAAFLLRAYNKDQMLTAKAWSAIKSCCSQYFASQYELILFNFIPNFLKVFLENAKDLKDSKKFTIIFNLPSHFSDFEKSKFEEFFLKNPPKFMR